MVFNKHQQLNYLLSLLILCLTVTFGYCMLYSDGIIESINYELTHDLKK